MKKILLIENILEEGWSAPNYFQAKGYDTHTFDLSSFYRKPGWKIIRKLRHSKWIDAVSKKIIDTAQSLKPNIIILWNLDYLSYSSLSALKNLIGIEKIICWHGDDLLNPRFDITQQILKIPLIDIHVTPRHHLKDEYRSFGARCVVPVSWYRKSLRNDMAIKDIPLSFFGSIDNKRLEYINSFSNENSHIGGYGWRKVNLSSNFVVHNHLSLTSMNNLIARSNISLNMFTADNRDRTNFRNFEIPSQFSFQICERSDDICEIFGEDLGIVCFSTIDELKDKVGFYFLNEYSRSRITSKSYNIVSDYKYTAEYQYDVLNKFFND